ncbi:MAG TPA: hypothetical protein VGN69_03985, partial [Solirubrobacteraceae bacterium]|nr:hypothetical protein [Solirubrobacteraceae bacterium]
MAKRPTRGETLRSAVDQTFQAAAGQAQVTRDRAQELVDELGHTAGRLRDALDELRPPSGDDLRGVRGTLAALEARVEALERALKPGRSTPKSRSHRKGPGAKGGSGRSTRPGASKSSSKSK